MKNLAIAAVLLFGVLSCRKSPAPEDAPEDAASPAPYDTTAIDSFSSGASQRSNVLPDSLPKERTDTAKSIKKDSGKP